jgi:CRISPR/Cas system CMR-associated protein Cmr5 small subunit
MSTTIDIPAFLREFGLSVVIVLFVGWVIHSIAKTFVPRVAEAVAKRIEAGTKLVEVTTSTVEKLPEVIAQNGRETRAAIEQSGKETRDAIASYEKAVITSEARLLDAFKTTLIAIKDEIFDEKQEKLEKGIARLSRAGSIPDSETPPALSPTK